MVDAGHTLVKGQDMMSPERGEVTGVMDRYISPLITFGTAGCGVMGVGGLVVNKLDKGNTIYGVIMETIATIEENSK